MGGPQEVGMVQVDDASRERRAQAVQNERQAELLRELARMTEGLSACQFRRLVLRSLGPGILALALAGCGSEGGGGAAVTEAPLCDMPADLECPEGMRTETVSGALEDGTWCYEGDVRHPLKLIRNGAPFWYSAPPFDTMVGCWPPDVAETAYSVTYGYGTADPTGSCFDERGAVGSCAELDPAFNAAWGLGQ